MDWSDFIFWWLEWPLKIAVTGILAVALLLFLNNIILLVFRHTALAKTRNHGYVPTDNMGYRDAFRAQFGESGRFHHLFKWYGWFWFKKSR